MKTASAAEVQKNFGAFRQTAQDEPVIVHHRGQPSVVILSVQEYQRLEDLDRAVVRFDELTDDELAAIAEADIPEQLRYDSSTLP